MTPRVAEAAEVGHLSRTSAPAASTSAAASAGSTSASAPRDDGAPYPAPPGVDRCLRVCTRMCVRMHVLVHEPVYVRACETRRSCARARARARGRTSARTRVALETVYHSQAVRRAAGGALRGRGAGGGAQTLFRGPSFRLVQQTHRRARLAGGRRSGAPPAPSQGTLYARHSLPASVSVMGQTGCRNQRVPSDGHQ